ncbi:DUF262 domain-containing protein [Microcoleus sp. herbarium2]|uniref:DUF262 domain-containing protein n=1 Tax=Microcoleus sp. herbarium2 TaxID=3055433 RepID=UPI002FD5EDAE
MQIAPFEEKMWESSPTKTPPKISDSEINHKYELRENRILTEINREKLPSFVQALKNPGYMEMRPFYQRRARWTPKMQSKLIESFLINIPVPSIILYEKDYNSYEVMDGQQRITAIQDFYENKLSLTGLEIWDELNGRTYNQLPQKIRAGIDRRSISSTVIIAESTSDPEEALFLKQKTFERLNTGGVDLSQQEVRNCLYYGKFNELLLKLSRHPIFAEAWGIPTEDNSAKLEKNTLYKKMEDAELVLRFFALRNVDKFQRGMEGFLDLYMMRSLKFDEEDINHLESIFIKTITIAHLIYGEHLFKPFDNKTQTWSKKSLKAYYDAIMVGLSRYLPDETKIIAIKDRIIEETKNIFKKPEASLFTGSGKTKADIQQRIRIVDEMLSQVIGE